MRLRRVLLPEFRNLRSFEVLFDAGTHTTTIVGKNGTGKSNLIEAIVTIFRDLDKGISAAKATPFAYELEYTIRGHDVTVRHQPAPDEETTVELDGEELRGPKVTKAVLSRILPDTVFAYYSGPSDRLQAVFEAPLQNFRDAMIRGDRSIKQRMIYGRLIHSKFVLLSFLAEGGVEAFPFLSSELDIHAVESILFVMHKPYWAQKNVGVTGKASFWGAKGIVRDLLDGLYRHSLAPLLLRPRVSTGIRQTSQREHIYLFLPHARLLEVLTAGLARAGSGSRARDLFTTLESAYVSDLIADVHVTVRKRNVANGITFTELSEGEQQLVMVLGLLRFTKEEESLFLLDEPDTHLNPAWSLKFLDFVDAAVGDRERSQLIIASHDPVAVSLLRKNQVRQLAVDQESGLITATEPVDDPINLGVAGVLLSELFGFRSILAPEVAELVEERARLRADERDLSEAEAEVLRELDAKLADVDISNIHTDPLYGEFLKAMLTYDRNVLAEHPVLERDEVLDQQRRFREVVRSIREGSA